MNGSLLVVEGLTINFAATGVAVDAVDLAVERSKTLCIIGESGCGKSVLALSILGLLPPSATIARGRIAFDGMNLVDKTGKELRRLRGSRIAMIFQEPSSSLDPLYTVGRQIVEVLRAHRFASTALELRQIAQNALARVGIDDPVRCFDQYPHQLSGGMQQRVMIAMAVGMRPDLLIADEPTTALDVSVQAQILTLLKDLQRETGMALIFITHDLGVVAQMADEVAVMYAGRVVERAPVAELHGDPHHPYTIALLGCVPRMKGESERLLPIEGSVPPPGELATVCSFHPRCVFAASDCRSQRPELREISVGHFVSCLRAPIEDSVR